MQNTRLSILVDHLSERLVGWLRNPWRRISITVISVLLGNFLASVVSTTAGQQARVDAAIAAMMVVATEVRRTTTSSKSV